MIDISVSDKHVKPQVIHTDQFENGVHMMRFTIADYMQNDVDLRKFKAYVVTSIKGVMDIAEVPYTISGRSLILTWSLSSHTLKDPGVIQYQLRFSESEADGTSVWSSYKGVIINRIAIDAIDHMSANYPTLMKQWVDLMYTLSGAFGSSIKYMLPGESIPVEERLEDRVYYQWQDVPNTRATCASGTVNLGKRPYADSGLYINNTHICVDTTDDEVYVLDAGIWVDAVNNADCGVIATDISAGEDIILLISAKDSGASGNDIGLKLDVAVYGKAKGIGNPSGGHVSASTLSGGSDSTVGVDLPKGHFEDYNGNILRSASMPDYSNGVTINSGDTVPVDALLVISGSATDGYSISAQVDDVTVISHNCGDGGYSSITTSVPVPVGSVITLNRCTAVYYPYK